MPEQRDHWSSRAGFVLAAAGSAVGLGNLWKFPPGKTTAAHSCWSTWCASLPSGCRSWSPRSFWDADRSFPRSAHSRR